MNAIDSTFRDIRYGVRSLLMRPGFTAIAVVILALGIGATTTIFSVVDALLLRALPYPDAEQLVILREVGAQGNQMALTGPDFEDVQTSSQSFLPGHFVS
jgi:putative ABC transport system permease protein